MFFKQPNRPKTKPHHILDNVAPGLTAELEKLSLDQRMRFLVNAFELSVKPIQTIDPEIERLLQLSFRGNGLTADQIQLARSLAESSDEKYFELEKQSPNSKVGENWFRNARLATALSNAYGNRSLTGTADAIYELSVILDDASELFAIFKSGSAKV